jgi:hypothetical protein
MIDHHSFRDPKFGVLKKIPKAAVSEPPKLEFNVTLSIFHVTHFNRRGI